MEILLICNKPVLVPGETGTLTTAAYLSLFRSASREKIHHLFVIGDAAQAIDSFTKANPCSFGHLYTVSFHESKNVISGEGGLLVVNENSLPPRAEIIWEKGTNRAAMFQGEVQ